MAHHPLRAEVNTGQLGTVYLLHFDAPFGHATHYRGWAAMLAGRLLAHVNGQGAKLTHHVRAAGIGWSLARTWDGVDRNFERLLKNRGGASRMCPICRGEISPTQVPHYGPTQPVAAAAEALLAA